MLARTTTKRCSSSFRYAGPAPWHCQAILTVQSITLEQIRNAIKQYLLPIFSSDTAIGSIAVSASKVDEVEQGFKDLGFHTERRTLPALDSDESEGSQIDESGSENEESD